jgi:hypothetical protein
MEPKVIIITLCRIAAVAICFKSKYQSLKGARVNMTYYSAQETVAGIDFDVMKVVRITRG